MCIAPDGPPRRCSPLPYLTTSTGLADCTDSGERDWREFESRSGHGFSSRRGVSTEVRRVRQLCQPPLRPIGNGRQNQPHAHRHRPPLRLGGRRDGGGRSPGRRPSPDRVDRARPAGGTDPSRGSRLSSPSDRGTARRRRPCISGGGSAGVCKPSHVGCAGRDRDGRAPPVNSSALRAWPDDFPDDIARQRRVPYESRADSVMYLEVLAEQARARGWAVAFFDAKNVEAEATRLLGDRAHAVLHGPREMLGPPCAKDGWRWPRRSSPSDRPAGRRPLRRQRMGLPKRIRFPSGSRTKPSRLP